jgi:3',5'-cyclic AMP phosphodiesterase CpdA
MKRRDALRNLTLGVAAGWTGSAGNLARAAEGTCSEPVSKRSVRFVHLTDTHVYAGRSAAQGLAQAIRHIHALPDRPAFILNGGDAIMDALEVPRDQVDAQWELWLSTWRENSSLPLRHCLGNHDVWGWNKAKSKTTGHEPGWGKQVALERLGLERSHYRFDEGPWRFLVLDSMTFDDETAYRAELDTAQFDWLRGELRDTPPTMPVVLVSHVPILTVGTVGFSTELRKFPQASRMLAHRDALELLQLFRQHPNVKLCLSGHTHLTETISFAGIDFVNSGAICGLWWKGNFHHTDEGYNVVDLFDDGTYRTQYIGYGWEVAGAGAR